MEEENKVEAAKVEPAKTETSKTKVEEKKEEKKCCGKGLCKSGICKKACKNKGIIVAIVALLLLIGISYGVKTYREKVDIGSDAIKTKVQKFIESKIPAGTALSVKNITKDGSLYKLTITIDKQDVIVYASPDGKKLVQEQYVANLDQTVDPNAQQAAAPAQQPIPKADKPTIDLYVMAFCPYGNKAEDTLKPVYDLLKNKVNFNFHYIVTTQGSEVQSLHGPKEVTEDEKEACVLKTYGKDKWMGIATYVNTNCGSDGACFDAGAKTLGINSATVNACVASQGLALMQENEKASNSANATGSPTMMINGVSSTAVYQYGNPESYKQQICDAFNTAPAECAKKLAGQPAAAAGGSAPAAACAVPATNPAQ